MRPEGAGVPICGPGHFSPGWHIRGPGSSGWSSGLSLTYPSTQGNISTNDKDRLFHLHNIANNLVFSVLDLWRMFLFHPDLIIVMSCCQAYMLVLKVFKWSFTERALHHFLMGGANERVGSMILYTSMTYQIICEAQECSWPPCNTHSCTTKVSLVRAWWSVRSVNLVPDKKFLLFHNGVLSKLGYTAAVYWNVL